MLGSGGDRDEPQPSRPVSGPVPEDLPATPAGACGAPAGASVSEGPAPRRPPTPCRLSVKRNPPLRRSSCRPHGTAAFGAPRPRQDPRGNARFLSEPPRPHPPSSQRLAGVSAVNVNFLNPRRSSSALGEHFVQRSFLPAGVAPPLPHVNDSTRSFGGSCRWLLSTSPFATPGTSLVTPTTVTSAATSSSSDLGHGSTLGHISRGAVSGFCCPFPDADMGLTRSHGFFKRPAVFCIWFQSQVTHSHLERTQQ